MADLILSSTSELQSNILLSYLTISTDHALSSSVLINSNFKSKLLREVKCINCQFNSGKSSVKNGPKCFRLARFQNENLNIDCIMYKKIKDN